MNSQRTHKFTSNTGLNKYSDTQNRTNCFRKLCLNIIFCVENVLYTN